MKRFAKQQRQLGQALLATLALFVVMVVLIGAALRANVTRRTELKFIQDRIKALHLAESGFQTAIHSIAAGEMSEKFERDVGFGRWEVTWRRCDGQSGLYEITSVGISRTEEPTSPRRTVQARVQIENGRTRVLSWKAL